MHKGKKRFHIHGFFPCVLFEHKIYVLCRNISFLMETAVLLTRIFLKLCHIPIAQTKLCHCGHIVIIPLTPCLRKLGDSSALPET